MAGHDTEQVETMKPVKERVIKVTFNADRHASMQWNFRPQQAEIFVRTCCLCDTSDQCFKPHLSSPDPLWS